MNSCAWYLIRVDFCTPLLLSCVYKVFLAIWNPKVTTKGTLDFSSTLFFASLDSPSTWKFLDDVWELPCIMFEDFNFPFHGMLLNPLIKNSCGPLINCDSYSTFDETSPFLVSPSFVIFIGEYQLTISSNTTSLLITLKFKKCWNISHLYFMK